MWLKDKPWDKNLQLFLALIVTVNLLPHASTMPAWVSIASFSCIFWKVLYLVRGWQLPKRWVIGVAAAIAAIGVFLSFFTLVGQEASGAMLVLMASLKLLETNRYRDAMLVIFTSYFLLMVHLLESQSLPTTLFLVGDVILITLLMFQVHRRERPGTVRRNWKRDLLPAGRMLAVVTPLWVFLFFVFPHFSTQLWNSKPANADTGFSDDLNPGSVGRLAESDETAFRVRFNLGNAPHPEGLYWRGEILTVSDGLRWTKTPGSLPVAAYEEQARVASTNYDIYLESGFSKWLFALDTPVALTSSDTMFLKNVVRAPGFIYQLNRPSFQRVFYQVTSVRQPPRQIMSENERTRMTKLPQNMDERVLTLAHRLTEKAEHDLGFKNLSPNERLGRSILKWFGDSAFRYSRAPGALTSRDGTAQLAEFLFQRRLGFCEHYAAAFATLMRAMGVPSRVVVGFQGGVSNNFGGYLLVRKLDAHAWTEIWIDQPDKTEHAAVKRQAQRGYWLRMDPTEVIAPLRLQLGGDYYKVDPTTITAGVSSDLLRQQLASGLSGAFRRAGAAWDVLQMQWNSFLLLYDLDFQMRLLAHLGIAKGAMWWLAGSVAAGALLFTILLAWRLRRRDRKIDPVLKDWRRFCDQLAKYGVERKDTEGPLDFTARAARALPHAADAIRAAGALYTEIRYAGATDHAEESPRNFRQTCRQSLRLLSSRAANSPVAES